MDIGCFQFLTGNKAAMKICVQVFVWMYTFISLYMVCLTLKETVEFSKYYLAFPLAV